ncbi:hypothetical protein KAR02_01900 [Candidatus Bipolaricaulota bacterium]|nr:hypothetical protein [Candidatus Bipolaricaulota bacterium]
MNPTDAIQLTSWKTHLLLPLFQALTPRLLQVEAALTGQTRCSLYVDHVEEPQAAALRIGICWYIAGNPSPEFLQDVNELLPRDTYSVLILDPSLTADQREILCHDLYFVSAQAAMPYARLRNLSINHWPLAVAYSPLIAVFLKAIWKVPPT